MAVNQQSLMAFLGKYNSNEFKVSLKPELEANSSGVVELTLAQIQAQCSKINRNLALSERENSASHDADVEGPAWRKGEFKLFCWFTSIYATTIGKRISQFDEEDYLFFSTIFLLHKPQRIRYELRCLLPLSSCSKQKWSSYRLACESSEKTGKHYWKNISFNLYKFSSYRFIRTFKECREKWMNHCDPQLNKQDWSKEQDLRLFRQVIRQGRQWSRIAKSSQLHRTEHMIKNRYNSLIHKQRKQNPELSISKLEGLVYQKLNLNQQHSTSCQDSSQNSSVNGKEGSQISESSVSFETNHRPREEADSQDCEDGRIFQALSMERIIVPEGLLRDSLWFGAQKQEGEIIIENHARLSQNRISVLLDDDASRPESPSFTEEKYFDPFGMLESKYNAADHL